MVSANGFQNNDISGEPGAFAHVFRALRGRNYRLFFIGQGISLIGTWMQQVAMSWLVYSMTNSAFLLGVVAFSSTIFSFILAPFTGVLVDRLNRHRIVVITQSLSMVQALALTAVVMTGNAAVWNLILLSAVLGIINAVDMPTRQSFVIEMVDNKEDLSNAIALNSSLFNSARLIGPSVAGILVATIGEGLCFLANGLSFIAVIACLLAMKISPKPAGTEQPDFFKGMKEGLNYAFGFAPIRNIILLLSFASLVIMPYTVLLPVFASQILKGGASILGFLTTAAGVGALVGAIYMATRKSVVGIVRILVIASLIFGVGLIMLSFTRVLWLSLMAMSLAGFGMVVTMASCNTFLQSIADDDKRGRVMGFYVMAFMGLAPFGSLLYGGLASSIGTPATLLSGGGLYIAGALIFAWKFSSARGAVRDAYRKKGIISG
ncbi:MAG: MFS transporter [Dehalococcoidia bacterium]|jgi:MFS family permease